MVTAQDLNELRYIVLLEHGSAAAPDTCREDACYLVGQWPQPELAILAKDDKSVIEIFDSVYFSPKMTHAKVYQSINDARKDVRWLSTGRELWKTNIMAVHAKIFFVAGLGKNKWE